MTINYYELAFIILCGLFTYVLMHITLTDHNKEEPNKLKYQLVTIGCSTLVAVISAIVGLSVVVIEQSITIKVR